MPKQESQEKLYTKDQIATYLARINFPLSLWPTIDPATGRPEEGLKRLGELQMYQLAAIPFENLSLHYSKSPGILLDKDDLFEKIVTRRRGGYCMELNFFFATILKTFGYEVIQIGARVFGPSGEFGGW
jgi:arylamine N-acetyltransferase